MGNENNKETKRPATTSELQTYIMIVQAKLTQSRNKKVADIRKKRDEAVKYMNDKNIEMAKLKIEGIMRNEDLISAFDVLSVLCEILKEKVTYILSSKTCPEDLRATVDTMIYASTRVDIEEFQILRDIIGSKYGEKYILDSNSNASGLVNVNVVKKMSLSPYSDILLSARLRSVANEAGIDLALPEEVMAPITNFSNPFSNIEPNYQGDNNMNYQPQQYQNPYSGDFSGTNQYMVSGQAPNMNNQNPQYSGGNQYFNPDNPSNLTDPNNYYNPQNFNSGFPNAPQQPYNQSNPNYNK